MPVRAVTILTYHQVGRFTRETVRRQRGNYVDAGRFTRQVRMLRALGFRPSTLVAVSDWLAGRCELPPRSLVLTFDDAYTSVYEHAGPVLQAYGWPATTFVVTGLIGRTNDWDTPRGIEAARLMDDAQLAELRARGWEIGAHSRTHPCLVGMDAAALAAEVAGAREDLAATGIDATSWCYPYGALDPATVDAVRAAGYRAAVTLEPGVARRGSEPLRLPRVHVGYRVTSLHLVARLAAALRR